MTGATTPGRISAKVWDSVLTVYARWLPNHPGKWGVLDRLSRRAQPVWGSRRVAKCQGSWFDLNLRSWVDRDVYFRQYEYWESKLLRRIVGRGWVVADVGANIGYYTLLLARLVGAGGYVYAFEPDGATYAALSRNINLNGLQNAKAVRAALSDSSRLGSLAVTDGRPHATHLAAPGEGCSETVNVGTLDLFLANLGVPRLDFIKVDIEGHEACFLDGARTTLDRFRPVIQVELNSTMLAHFGASPQLVVARLVEAGYSLYRLNRWRLMPLRALPGSNEIWNVWAFDPDTHHGEMRTLAIPCTG